MKPVPPPIHPVPKWHVAEAVERLMVVRGIDDAFLVELPAQSAGKPVGVVRAFAVSNEIPTKIVWATTEKLVALIDASSAKPAQTIRVYPIPADGAVSPLSGVAVDATPIRGRAARTAGMDFPRTLAELRHLESRFDTPVRSFAASSFFEGLKPSFETWYKGDWTRKSHWVELQSWLLVPETTALTFGLAGVAPAWLLLDGKETMAHPEGLPYDKWTEGRPVKLTAGLHQMRVLTVCRQEIDTGVAWKHPGADELAKEVVMVTGGDLRVGRWERKNVRVHPFATATPGRSYRFAGQEGCFVPYALENEGKCWGTNAVCTWKIAGLPDTLSGEKVAATLLTSRMPIRAEAILTAATGESAAYPFDITYDGPVCTEEYVTTRVAGVPSICREDDRIQPMIRMRTSAKDGLTYEVVSKVVYRDGSAFDRDDKIVTDRGWARVYLDAHTAGKVKEIVWTLRHAGLAIDQGRVRFLHEPYDTLPDAVSGETLKAGTDFLIPVVSRASRGEPVPSAVSDPARGMLLIDGGYLGGAESAPPPEGWRCLHLPEAARTPLPTGMAWLRPFTAISNALPAAVVCYAPCPMLSDIGHVAEFELRVSAMVAFLTSPAAGSPAVRLVIPPMLDRLPDCGCASAGKPCPHAAQTRLFAESVMRVADVYGIETVDLFTAFGTALSGPPPAKDGQLTEEGRKRFFGIWGR